MPTLLLSPQPASSMPSATVLTRVLWGSAASLGPAYGYARKPTSLLPSRGEFVKIEEMSAQCLDTILPPLDSWESVPRHDAALAPAPTHGVATTRPLVDVSITKDADGGALATWASSAPMNCAGVMSASPSTRR